VPVPILGAYVELRFPGYERLNVFADAQTTLIDVIGQDAISGSLIDVRVGARYKISENLFVAGGYRIFNADYDLDTGASGDSDHVSFDANGITVYLTFRF
jgi:hypothetical protein